MARVASQDKIMTLYLLQQPLPGHPRAKAGEEEALWRGTDIQHKQVSLLVIKEVHIIKAKTPLN